MTEHRILWRDHHAVLPVIHVESYTQARTNLDIVIDTGCDGTFFINHVMSGDQLLDIVTQLRNEYPSTWLGMNALGWNPCRTLQVATKIGLDGVWSDNAGVDERLKIQPSVPTDEFRTRSVMYFGGVAFKYQRPVKEHFKAAHLAAKHVDVVTTSGPGTGEAANLANIKEMWAGSSHMALLGIASGLTSENVREYLPYANCLLVATGVSKNWRELDVGLLKKFVEKVRTWRDSHG